MRRPRADRVNTSSASFSAVVIATAAVFAASRSRASGPGPSPVASPRVAAAPGAPGPTPSTTDSAAERPWSVQLHVHGSFSEGVGSMDSHSWEAKDVGADAIWWSDHDFRVGSYRHPATFGFEDWTEPLDRGEPWREVEWLPRGRADERDEDAGPPGKGVRRVPIRSLDGGDGAIVAERADEGARSFRVKATGHTPEFAGHLYALKASRALFKRPLASRIAVALSVFPENAGPDARAVVEIGLSEHAPRGGLPMQGHSLRYVLGEAAFPARRFGNSAEIGVAVETGRWNRVVLKVTEDVVAAFPEVRGEDNSMASIAIGVESRADAEASALFDRFRIEQALSGRAAWARQAALIGEVAGDYPGLVELQGSEVSYASHHLNEFTVDTGPLDYDGILAEVGRRRARDPSIDAGGEVARIVVDRVHAAGGLVSYNHMYGAPMAGRERLVERDEVLADLVRNRLFGADILEVGYRDRGGHDLADHVGVWDDLADHGLFPVGVGVSDSHGGGRQRWRGNPNNFVTWILAPAPTKADLLEGLRAGRAFFGDRTLFDGSIDLSDDHGFRMGQLVVTDRPRAEVKITVRGLAAGDVIRVVCGDARSALPVSGAEFVESRAVEPSADGPTVFRIEAEDARRTAKVLSNPIVYLRSVPRGGLAPARGGFDVGGLVARSLPRFHLEAVAPVEGGVALRGRAEGARIEIDAVGFGVPASVESEGGIVGRWEWRPPLLVVDDLRGEGRIFVRRAAPGAPAPPPGPRPIASAPGTGRARSGHGPVVARPATARRR